MAALTLQTLKSHLWNCAEILRGSAVDRTDWKAYILPLLFFKRICDVWDEETAEATALYGDVDPVDFPEIHRFDVPEGCHWRDIREAPANVGAALSRAMREIERTNPDTLYRVFGASDWSNREMLTDEILKDLIEGLCALPLGNAAVGSDILGDAYEYLIGWFAEITKRKKAREFYTPRSVVRMMVAHETDYRWLTQVYESVKPSTGTGRLLWHALGPKTIELIHEHVHVDAIRDDLETLVLDADLLEAVLGSPDPNKKAKEIEIKVAQRLRRRMHDPRFRALSERLEELKLRHEQGVLFSIDFLKALLELAHDVVAAEQTAEPIDSEDLGKAALTELFESARNADTPIMVERVVTDIDEIVRYVRFDGWQNTHAGEREVKMALRKTLFKYKLHQDQELFDRAYGYVRMYY